MGQVKNTVQFHVNDGDVQVAEGTLKVPLTNRITLNLSPHTAVDMLSPGDKPSRRPAECSRGWGLLPGVVGGCGGGKLGLCRGGLGVGLALVRVPASEGGEERDGVVAIWICPGEPMVAYPCG